MNQQGSDDSREDRREYDHIHPNGHREDLKSRRVLVVGEQGIAKQCKEWREADSQISAEFDPLMKRLPLIR
jgi:hypothetical protein